MAEYHTEYQERLSAAPEDCPVLRRFAALPTADTDPGSMAALLAQCAATCPAAGPGSWEEPAGRGPLCAALAHRIAVTGPGLAGPLLAALQHAEPGVRIAGAQALALLGVRDAVEPLLRLVRAHDAAPGVAIAALEALGSLGDGRARAICCDLLDNRAAPERLRRSAARVLGRLIGEEEHSLARLSRLLREDAAWLVRLGAVEGLAFLCDVRAIRSLVAALRDDHPAVRQRAAEASGGLLALLDEDQGPALAGVVGALDEYNQAVAGVIAGN